MNILKRTSPSDLLICFHHAGGSGRVFKSWEKALPACEVLAVDMPNRGENYGKPFPKDVRSYAEKTAETLKPLIGSRPFVLYGHSLGALNAFLTAYFLEQDHITAKGLVVSGRHAPNQPNPSPYQSGMGRDVLLKTIRDYGMTPEELLGNKDFLDYYLPVIEKDYAWSETYEYHGELLQKIPIRAHAAVDDPEANPEMMSLWKDMTLSDFSTATFEGGHFFPFNREEAHLKILKETLSRWFYRDQRSKVV